jgi:ADP-ribose pyrophosphatase YjhB (NUDIX family)
MKYCSECGSILEIRVFERQRKFCAQCQRIHYAQLKVGAGAIIERNESLLMLQRTMSAFQGSWNIPAGFVEVDESPLAAVVRETYEETGLHVEAKGLVDIYFFADDPRGNGILIVYECHPVGGELRATDEAINPTFFPVEDIPGNLAGGGHNQAVSAWKKRLQKNGSYSICSLKD